MNKLNFELLHIFEVVSRFASFSQASNYLYLDQSTVSKKIRQLEAIVNKKLFIRNTDGIVLTAAGLAFKNKSDKILQDLKEIIALKPTITTLRVGVFDNISAYLMPDIFAENFNQFKRLKISSNSIELVNLFNEGKLDAIVINSDFFTQIQGSAIETQITNESFAILFRKNNALIASQNSISLNDLKNKNRKSK
ncbi:LysR family transcriptional regulator [Lactobacillus crispatus]|uniref:LysR family transcriptional regulator n=2 Tax=Lactobacillus crispatus TaxID=47770 RepID=A0A5M9YZG5_9LACO|nr:LysR family transcriptional regulator [Lactobacillus crispatus]KAA8811870.1 LysR family transcriptional regulator [Lactobacillus crispatus]KRK32457.1 transcriptional regulator [Lactobacillus crispatus DSM 20584 = JCM 1185 = ATCC 33820]MBW9143732.1 LysR family transcriptional regulator [Lactobacillus crispatus]ORE80525.1 transcriptional regulator [Lactobacillus crispatus]QWW28194.1 LysR family transcriptional regulator [Lactobacillus crispatus]